MQGPGRQTGERCCSRRRRLEIPQTPNKKPEVHSPTQYSVNALIKQTAGVLFSSARSGSGPAFCKHAATVGPTGRTNQLKNSLHSVLLVISFF